MKKEGASSIFLVVYNLLFLLDNISLNIMGYYSHLSRGCKFILSYLEISANTLKIMLEGKIWQPKAH